MSTSLTNSLLSYCVKGGNRLNAAVKKQIALFANAELDKILGGKTDAYYLSFALVSLCALGENFDKPRVREFIGSFDFSKCDIAHLASFARASFLAGGNAENISRFLPPNELETPYDIFLALGAAEDCGADLQSIFDLRQMENFRSKNGAFSNMENADFAGANASSAALYVLKKTKALSDEKTLEYLLNSQDASGGFKAQDDSQCPDLLSTASALFALRECEASPKYESADFVLAHYLSEGAFSATVFESAGDCEYLFYGLLALGASE